MSSLKHSSSLLSVRGSPRSNGVIKNPSATLVALSSSVVPFAVARENWVRDARRIG